MARAQGARALMALAFETTYGTPPAGGFTKMPFASTSLGAEQPLLNSELLGYPQQSPWLSIADRQMELMCRYMTEMGLTPSSPMRLSVANRGDQDSAIEFRTIYELVSEYGRRITGRPGGVVDVTAEEDEDSSA